MNGSGISWWGWSRVCLLFFFFVLVGWLVDLEAGCAGYKYINSGLDLHVARANEQ